MYKKLKKLMAIAVIATLAIVEGLLPISAEETVFSGGAGTAENPYLISTAEDLVKLSALSLGESAADYNGKHYKVTADIDMNGVADFKGIGWGTHFSGVFDGDYHSVKNLTFSSDGFAGFFNLANGATIKNFGLENLSISGNTSQGMGGFIGRNFNSIGTTTIENCYVRNITLSNSNGSNAVGAFVGNEAVAGIVIKNCYSAQLSGGGIQGLVGNQYGAPQGGSTISNCYSTGNPWSKFGTADPANTTNVYKITTSATAEQMTGLGSAFAEDVNGINGGLPVLAWENTVFSGGAGTEADPYLISKPADLVELSTKSLGSNASSFNGKYYKVTADIDMNGVADFKGIGWGTKFSGVFDGNYHIVRNLTFSSDGFAGFFNLADGATIKNFGLENLSISGNISQGMGGFIGRNFNSNGTTTIENCYVRNITLSNSNGSNAVGAFVGNEAVAGIVIKNCYSAQLSGRGIQGLVGNQYGAPQGGSTISNCYSTGNPWSNFGTADPANTTNVYKITTSATAEQLTGLGSAFAKDYNRLNSGLPVLVWENARYPDPTANLTFAIGSNGSVKVNDQVCTNETSLNINIGAEVSITVTPEEGYVIDTIKLGETPLAVSTAGTVGVTMPDEDTLLTVTFKVKTTSPVISGNSSYNYFKTENGRPTAFVYGKLSDFYSPGLTAQYGMKLWIEGEEDYAIVLPAMENETSEAIATPGKAFAIKVYGNAITADKRYVFQPYVGDSNAGDQQIVSFSE